MYRKSYHTSVCKDTSGVFYNVSYYSLQTNIYKLHPFSSPVNNTSMYIVHTPYVPAIIYIYIIVIIIITIIWVRLSCGSLTNATGFIWIQNRSSVPWQIKIQMKNEQCHNSYFILRQTNWNDNIAVDNGWRKILHAHRFWISYAWRTSSPNVYFTV